MASVGPEKNPIMFISIRIDQPKQVQTGHTTWLATTAKLPVQACGLRLCLDYKTLALSVICHNILENDVER
mgnify:CR=1 FL=1